MYARDVLSRPVVTVRPETPLPHAIKLLTEHGFAALPVVDEHDQVIGMLSESDVLAAQTDQYRATVQTAMTVPAEVVQPVTEVGAIAQRMLTGHLRSMPVVEAGVLVGIIARRDLLRALIRDDTAVEAKIRALLDTYLGSRRQWTIGVTDGRAIIRGRFADAAEQHTISVLVLTVAGVEHVEIAADPAPATGPAGPPLSEWLHQRADETIA